MSAWYILSAMGFYQAEPGSGRYWFGSPLVDEAEITVEKGIFRVVVENNSNKNRYIQSVELNGKAYDKGYIEHKDIAAGGTLTFRMGTEKKIWY
jgi:putative alpha-1,2-mannosidase